MGRTPKAKNVKSAAAAYATPQLSGAAKRQNQKILKSEPLPKRKRLAQELDDEISDEEFETQLGKMREIETKRKIKKKHSDQNSRRALGNSTDEDNSEDDNTEESDEEEDEESDDEDKDDNTDEDNDVSDSENELDSETSEEDDEEDSDEEDEDMDVSSNSEGSEDDISKISKSIREKRQKTTKAESAKKLKQKTGGDKKTDRVCQIEAAEMSKDLDAKASRDKRTLFLKSLPKSVTIKEIQALSTDITEVRLHICKDRRGKDLKCAYVEFADEAIAVKNKSILDEKKINNQAISVDYVGEKSAFKSSNPPASSPLDPKKLYVSGFGNSIDAEDLKKLFPSASSIDIPRYKKENCLKGFAFVHFVDEKLCKAAHASMQNKSISGKQLTVMYAKRHKARKPKNSRHRKETNKLPKSVVGAEKKDHKEKKAISVNKNENEKKKSKI